MHAYVYFIIPFILLAACSPSEPMTDQTKNAATISSEQQQRDALAILDAENSLIEAAQAELNQVESLVIQRAELESKHNAQLLIEMALSENARAQAEQDLIENAKLASAKKQALLNQATKTTKDIPDSTPL